MQKKYENAFNIKMVEVQKHHIQKLIIVITIFCSLYDVFTLINLYILHNSLIYISLDFE
jgi:hypothetical protein